MLIALMMPSLIQKVAYLRGWGGGGEEGERENGGWVGDDVALVMAFGPHAGHGPWQPSGVVGVGQAPPPTSLPTYELNLTPRSASNFSTARTNPNEPWGGR